MSVWEKHLKYLDPVSGHTITGRRMAAKDLLPVSEIELLLFPTPWPKRAFEEEISSRDYSLPVVLLDDKRLVGYAISYFIFEEMHIANIGVHPDYQHHGIGSWIMRELFAIGKTKGAAYVHLEVRRSNLTAQALYGKLGFAVVGMRKNYYEKEHEDALLMTKLL
jgi:[ribosomal protein S18]-alanine N-acetyltransferase